jgi:CBS-domain-containing membrane protein/PII-like signaling protein
MTDYSIIKVYTREKARHEGKDMAEAVVAYVRSLRLAARCVVTRGMAGCYENGETASSHLVELSYDFPIVIDIILPATETETVIVALEAMVGDGVVAVVPATVRSFRPSAGLFPENLHVRDIMTPKPTTVHPDFSVRAMVELLLETGLKALPVVADDGSCVGIVAQNDLVKRAGMPARLGLLRLLPAAEREAWLARVEPRRCVDIMSAPPATVHQGTKVSEAIHRMNREKRKRLPVVDDHGRVVGMLSRIDVLKAVATTRATMTQPQATPSSHAQSVKDVESRDELALSQNSSIQAAIDALVAKGLQRVAVVDQSGVLVGLITDAILVGALGGRNIAKRLPGLFRGGRNDRPLSSIMIKAPQSITEDASIDEALRLMTEDGLKRLPVVDADGVFKGMIRRDSILLALAHTY